MLVVLRKLLAILPKKSKKKFILIFLGMLVGSFFDVVSIGSIPIFVSIIANPELVFSNKYIKPFLVLLNVNTADTLLLFGSLFLIMAFFLKSVFFFFFYKYQANFIFNTYQNLNNRLFIKYLFAPYYFILSRNTSEIVRKISGDTSILVNSIIIPILKLSLDLIIVIAISVLLISMEPTISTVIIILIGSIAIVYLNAVKKKTKIYGKISVRERKNIIKCINEALGGLKDIKVLKRENWFIAVFKKSVSNYKQSRRYIFFINAIVRYIFEFLMILSILVISVILFIQGRSLETVIPVLSLFAAAAVRLMPSIQIIINNFNQIKYNSHVVKPIYDDICNLDFEDSYKENIDYKHIKPLTFSDKIKIKNISFTYPNSDTKVIENMSFVIKKNAVVGFIGPTGSGKTTLIDIILGLLKPQEGEILIDNKNLNNYIPNWQMNVGYIPQFIFLTDDTIKRNIALGLPDDMISEEKINRAVKAAQLDDFVKSLPKGLETEIGERGIRLSGGQRQRIGIARALYHNPEVLIMDEATSSLDNETEKYIIEEINRLKGNRTIIIIAHRLTTIQNCDVIYTVTKGKVENT